MNQWHFGVVVGINCYPGISELNFAKADAEAFAEWLADPEGGDVPQENITSIVTDARRRCLEMEVLKAEPISRDVNNAIKIFRDKVNNHLKENAADWQQTRIYIYFSGHGIAPVASEAALLMANASANDYGENIDCSLLLDYLEKHQPFHEVVIFLDCCRQRPKQPVPLGGFPGTLTPRHFGQVLKVIGQATYFGELAFEPTPDETAQPDEQRGYFTRALLEGLRGDAPRNEEGMIDSITLGQYVKQRVSDLTAHRPHRQEPTMKVDAGNPIIFAKQKIINYQARLKFISPFNGMVELYDGKNRVIGQHDTANGDWVIQLPNSFYQVTPAGTQKGTPFRNEGMFKIWGENVDIEL